MTTATSLMTCGIGAWRMAMTPSCGLHCAGTKASTACRVIGNVLHGRRAGGYASQRSNGARNASRERIWFSPHCLTPEPAE